MGAAEYLALFQRQADASRRSTARSGLGPGVYAGVRGSRRRVGRQPLEIQHIGSTAIPGIYAKPVIDMLAVVVDIAAMDGRNAQMRSLGYEPKGEFGIPGRRYFYRNNPAGIRTHQIHAFAKGSPHIARHLAFRDFLRAHPKIALEYSELKRRLADAHPNDIEAYMDGKDAFIKETEAKALAWLAARRQ
jgi:GrpB-like predicted nucleotidyltransferase (UPF0157 family)